MSMSMVHSLLSTLRSRRPAFGAWLTLPNAFVARSIAQSSPELTWICIDCEHGLTSLHPGAAELVMAIEGASSSASNTAKRICPSTLVRIPAAGRADGGDDGLAWQAKYALDAGAKGVVVPMVNTAARAQEVAQACRFPPLGRRGYGSPFAPSLWGFSSNSATEYVRAANEQVVVLAQIETREAVNNVEEIVKVDGIDVVFIGPYDLSLSLGHPLPSESPALHPEVEDAIQHIRNMSHSAGKHVAIYCTSGEQAARRAAEGYDMINVTSDVGALSDSVRRNLSVAMTGMRTGTSSRL